jgi:hypothetical protein
MASRILQQLLDTQYPRAAGREQRAVKRAVVSRFKTIGRVWEALKPVAFNLQPS